jgi:hypothetical protein
MQKQISKYIILPLILLFSFSIVSVAQINFNDDDKDGLTNNLEETRSNTDPQLFDTDGDGYGDGYEWFFKDNGGDPLDPNKHPRQLSAEEDKDGDGFVDPFFDPNVFINLQIGSIITQTNIGPSKCNYPQVDRSMSQIISLDCEYELKGSGNNEYYLGFQLYNVALELTPDKYSIDCYIDNNKTINAKLVCKNVPYADAVLNSQKVILTSTQYAPVNRQVLEDSIIVDVVELGTNYYSRTLDQALDQLIPKSCDSVDVNEPTTCKFQLPVETTLPDNYIGWE